MFWVPNALIKNNKLISVLLLLLVLVFMLISYQQICLGDYIKKQMVKRGDQAGELAESYYYYTNALRIAENDKYILFKRGKIFLLNGEAMNALKDFEPILNTEEYHSLFQAWLQELETNNMSKEAKFVKLLLQARESKKPVSP